MIRHNAYKKTPPGAGRPGPGGVSRPLSASSRRSARPSSRRILELHDFPFFERPVDFTFFDFPDAALLVLLNTTVLVAAPFEIAVEGPVLVTAVALIDERPRLEDPEPEGDLAVCVIV